MQALPIVLIAFSVLLIAVAVARIAGHLRRLDLPDPTLAVDADTARLDDLVARKQVILRGIQTANLDRQTAKIADEEHARIVARFEREGAKILRELDAVAGSDEDRDAARAALDAALASVARPDEGEGWSQAAMMRHGGQAPATESP